eukprot:scaffold3731_cov156-Amphora_coffeaeformis.AAC.5
MKPISLTLSALSVVVLQVAVHSLAWTPPMETSNSRRNFLSSLVASGGALVAATTMDPAPTMAADRLNMSDEELKQIVKDDILKRQFLVTGNLTPEIYKPSATFTDEIDTYKMDQWMKGTQKLFVGEKSDVRLVGDVGKIVILDKTLRMSRQRKLSFGSTKI